MNKYFLKQGIRGMFKFTEDGSMDVNDYKSSSIDWTYYVDEDGTLEYIYGDKKDKVDVKKGDIVLQFYKSAEFPNPVVVIRNEQWMQNMEKSIADAKERAKKFAESGACKCPCENA